MRQGVHDNCSLHDDGEFAHEYTMHAHVCMDVSRCALLFCGVFNIILYVKMVKRRVVLFVCLFPGMLLLLLIGKYGRWLAE